MKWSILILTQPSRVQFLDRLMRRLAPQLKDDIELTASYSVTEKSLGENRYDMMKRAKGEYVNFVDDDDMVSPRYVESIYPLLDGVDYIGFPVQVYRDGVYLQTAYHSLKHKDWKAIDQIAYRDISHLNPMRRELALQATMEGGFGEDGRWAQKIRELGIVKTEHYVPETMYFYYMRTNKCEHLSPALQGSSAHI